MGIGRNGNAIVLDIEGRLTNLDMLRKQLTNVADNFLIGGTPGSKKFLDDVKSFGAAIDDLRAKTKNPINLSGSDLSGFTRELKHLTTLSEKFGIDLKKINFDDLDLKNIDLSKYNEIQGKIRGLEDNIVKFKKSAATKLATNADVQSTLGMSELGGDFDQIAEKIRKKYIAINAAYKNAEINTKKNKEELIDAQKAQAKSTEFTQYGAVKYLSSALKSIGKQGGSDEVAKKLQESVNGAFDQKGQFQSVETENAFYKTLQSQFKLDSGQIDKLRQAVTLQAQNAKGKITEAIQNVLGNDDAVKKILGDQTVAKAKELLSKTYSAQQNYTSANTDQENLKKQYESLTNAKNLAEQMGSANIGNINKVQESIRTLEADLENCKQGIVGTVIAAAQTGTVTENAKAEIAGIARELEIYTQKIKEMEKVSQNMRGVETLINRYIGLRAIVRKVGQEIKKAVTNIKDIDKTITGIAVVTNMSQEDLWGKIGQYSTIAQQYGASIKGVYEVSQIFYQQGLQTNDVMAMTVETLKMAKISGMGYAEAADAMTVATRAFNIEMENASRVTDVYSALAANFAVSSNEIATAMEKTASSAASVGMSVESTSAFMSVMIQSTREGAQNIGSALKSIISRYGEMKSSPSLLKDSEGEDLDYNATDKALKSIGISLKDAKGQFRDFDDIILELSKKWNTLDTNTQRYIGTVMAGNRQQSRFIALVSNYDELSRAISTANNAETASAQQVLKTMDSIETKSQNLKNAFQQLYLNIGLDDFFKGVLDVLTRITNTIAKLGFLKGVLPTIMNVFGMGRSLIAGVKGISDRAQKIIVSYRVQTEEAEKKITDLRQLAESPMHVQVDSSAIQDLKEQVQQVRDIAEAPMTVATDKSANGGAGATSPASGIVNTPSFSKKQAKKEAREVLGNTVAPKNIGANGEDKERINAIVDALQAISDYKSAGQTEQAQELQTAYDAIFSGQKPTNLGKISSSDLDLLYRLTGAAAVEPGKLKNVAQNVAQIPATRTKTTEEIQNDAAWQAKLNAATAEINQLKQEKAKNKEEGNTLTTELKTAQAAAEKANQQLEKKRSKLEELQAKLEREGHQSSLPTIGTDEPMQKGKKKTKNTGFDSESSEVKLQDKKKAVTNAEAEYKKKSTTLQQVTEKAEAAKRRSAELDQEIQQKKEQYAQLEKEKAESVSQLKDKKDQAAMKAEEEKATQALKDTQDAIKEEEKARQEAAKTEAEYAKKIKEYLASDFEAEQDRLKQEVDSSSQAGFSRAMAGLSRKSKEGKPIYGFAKQIQKGKQISEAEMVAAGLPADRIQKLNDYQASLTAARSNLNKFNKERRLNYDPNTYIDGIKKRQELTAQKEQIFSKMQKPEQQTSEETYNLELKFRELQQQIEANEASLASLKTTTEGLAPAQLGAAKIANETASSNLASAKTTEELDNAFRKACTSIINNTTLTEKEQAARVLHIQSIYDGTKATLENANAKKDENASSGAAASSGASPNNGEGPSNGNESPKPTPKDDKKSNLFSWKSDTARNVTSAAIQAARMASTAIVAIGASQEDASDDKNEKSKIITGLGNGLSGAATGASMGMQFGPMGAAIGAVAGFLATGLPAIVDGLNYTAAEKYANAIKEANKAQETYTKASAKTTSLKNSIEEYKKLQKTMYDSEDAMKQYKDACNNLANEYPSLIQGYDSEHNAIINLTAAEKMLIKYRESEARAAALLAKAQVRKAITENNAIKDALAGDTLVKAYGSYTFREIGKGSRYTGRTISRSSSENGAVTGLDSIVTNMSQSIVENVLQEILSGLDITNFKDEYGNYNFDEVTDEQWTQIQDTLSKSANPGDDFFVYGPRQQNNAVSDRADRNDFAERIDESTKILQDQNIILSMKDYFGLSDYDDDTWENAFKNEETWWDSVNEYFDSIRNTLADNTLLIESAFEGLAEALSQQTIYSFLNNSSLPDTIQDIFYNNENKIKDLVQQELTSQLTTERTKGYDFTSLQNWYTSDPQSYEAEVTRVTQNFMNNLSGLNSQSLTELFKLLSNNSYFTKKEYEQQLKKYLAEGNDLYKQAVNQFTIDNQQAKNLLLNKIWNNGDSSQELNSNLGGLTAAQNALGDQLNLSAVLDSLKGQLNDESPFTTSTINWINNAFSNVDDLFTQGLYARGNQMLEILSDIIPKLANSSSEIQGNIVQILNTTDFSSSDSIQAAIDSLNAYAKENNLQEDSAVTTTLNQLTTAKGNLVGNVVTLSADIATKLSDAADNIEKTISAAKSGLSFSDALTAWKRIAKANPNKAINFEEIFEFDAALGKWVYKTADALAKDVDAQQKELETKTTEAKKAYTAYQKLSEDNSSNTNWKTTKISTNRTFTGLNGQAYTLQKDSFITSIEEPLESLYYYWLQSSDENASVMQEALKNYYASTDVNYQAKTIDNFWKYFQEVTSLQQDAWKELQAQSGAFATNLKAFYFANVDFESLLLGTSTSNNNNMLDNLLKQLKLTGINAKNFTIDNYKAILAAYGISDPVEVTERVGQFVRTLASSSSTAITELLQGEGAVVSATTAALLKKADLSNLINPSNNTIGETDNLIESAIGLYKALANNFTTVTEKNNAYIQILESYYKKNKGYIEGISSGRTLDLSTINSLFTSLGLTVADYFDVDGVWKEDAIDGASFDGISGKLQIDSFETFANSLADKANMEVEIFKSTDLYLEAYHKWADETITNNSNLYDLFNNEIKVLSSNDLTVGSQVDVAALWTKNSDLFNEINGAIVDNGILTITDLNDYSQWVLSTLKTLSEMSIEDDDTKALVDPVTLAAFYKQVDSNKNKVYNTLSGITDYANISSDAIASLIESGLTNDVEVLQTFRNADGSYTIDKDIILNLIDNSGLDEATKVLAKKAVENNLVAMADAFDWETLIDPETTLADFDGDGIIQLAKANGKQINAEQANLIIRNLREGGLQALADLNSIGVDISKMDYSKLTSIYRASAENLSKAVTESESLVIGKVVDESIGKIYQKAGYGVTKLHNGLYVVTSAAGDLVNAASSLYNSIQESFAKGGSTLEELNNAFVNKINASNANSIAATNALANAAEISLSDLAKIFTEQGIKLTDEILSNENIFTHLGGDKYQIKNFTAFAQAMGWDSLSDGKYLEAFSAYNNAIIEYENKQKNAFVTELQALNGAKTNDRLNFTYITKEALANSDSATELYNLINKYSLSITDGILKITDEADISGFVAELSNSAWAAEQNIKDELLEIADSIKETLRGYSTTLSEGIKGTLSGASMNKLFTGLGIENNADFFTETAEGYRLTAKGIIAVYNALGSKSTLQQQASLKEVSEALSDSKGIRTVAQWLDLITKKEKEWKTADENKKEELEEELKLYKDIYYWQSLNNSESFDFTNNKLPEGVKSVENAWKSASYFLNNVSTGKTKGGISNQDWYNWTQMIGDIGVQTLAKAGTIKNDFTTAAQLYTAGVNTMKVAIDGSGDMVIDLAKTFETSYDNASDIMGQSTQDWIQTIANTQVKMLDAEIEMLDAVIAMEEIDSFDNLNFFLSDGGFFTEEAQLDPFIASLTKIAEQSESVRALLTQIGFIFNETGKIIGYDNKQIPFKEFIEALINYEWSTESDPLTVIRSVFDSLQQNIAQAAEEVTSGTISTTSNIETWNKAIELTGFETIEINEKYFVKTVNGKQLGPYPTDREAIDAGKEETGITNEVIDAAYQAIEQKKTILLKVGLTQYVGISTDGTQFTYQGESFDNLTDLYDAVLSKDSNLQISDTERKIFEASQNSYVKLQFGLTDSTDYTINLALNDNITPEELQNLNALSQFLEKIGASVSGSAELADNITVGYAASVTVTDNGYDIAGVDWLNGHYATWDELARTIIDHYQIDANFNGIFTVKNGQAAVVSANEFTNIINNVATLPSIHDTIKTISGKQATAAALKNGVYSIRSAIAGIGQTPVSVNVNVSSTTSGTTAVDSKGSSTNAKVTTKAHYTNAKGKVALAAGTLMGELGPELYVSNGRYHIAGRNGAEFVDLPNDAIVFNHQQTASLLSTGHAGRGNAVHGENAAIAYAKGNLNGGPAKAGASETRAALVSIRDQWKRLLNYNLSDIIKSSGGGGGNSLKAVLRDVEEWYNLMRQIENIEKNITLEQKKRANMTSGKDYVKSLQYELDLLQQQNTKQENLLGLQKSFFNEYVEKNKNGVGAFFNVDTSNGLLQYDDVAYQELKNIFSVDEYGNSLYYKNPADQLAAAKELMLSKGMSKEEFNKLANYSADGTKAEDDSTRLENIMDKTDEFRDTVTDTWDAINETTTSIYDNTAAQNKILQEFIDNQRTVEDLLLKAIEDREQALIDELSDQKNALSEAASDYVEGLNEALNREKELYQNNQAEQDLAKLQRKLAVLQRSGASSADIKSLQDDIDSQLQNQYFDQRQQEIENIRKANDEQLEKLQEQIDIQTDILAYQKDNGLLWNEVYDKMANWDANSIANFVAQNTDSLKNMSALQVQETMKESLQSIEKWVQYRKNQNKFENYYSTLSNDTLSSYGVNTNNADEMEAVKANARVAYEKVISEGKTEEDAQAAVIEELEKYKQQQEDKQKAQEIAKQANSKSSSSGSSAPTTTPVMNFNEWAAAQGIDLEDGHFKSKVILESVQDDYNAYVKKIQKVSSYSKGGLVDYTGLAMVHGSKKNPEAFISSEDRALMKNSIFSEKSQTLVDMYAKLMAFTDELPSKYSNANTNSNESIIIENISLNLDAQISNDYDAKRASQEIMNEIVKIARQTGNISLSRR